jgi:hypothetical protein
VASNVRHVPHEVCAPIAALEGRTVEGPNRLLEDGLAALVLDDQLPPHDVHAADLLEIHVPLVPDLLEHKLFVVEALGAQKRDGCLWCGSGGRHARTSMWRGPHYDGEVAGEAQRDQDFPTTTPTSTGHHASSCLRRVLLVLGLVLLAANLRPARAPDQTAARNGKVDAQLYTSVIGFLTTRCASSRPAVPGRSQCEPLPPVVRDGP